MSKVTSTGTVRLLASVLTIAGLAACANQNPGTNGVATDGFMETGIMGGTDATGSEDYSKSVVALYNVKETSLCTASIVSKQLLVTAAHCVAGNASDLRVIFGLNLTQNKNLVVQAVEATETSPLWASNQNKETNTGDIAMVKFSGGLPTGYQPVSFLADASQLKDGMQILLAGYGLSDGTAQTGAGILRSVSVPLQKAAFSKSEILMDQTNGKGACHGDSGGPAYITVNGKLTLVGVTSRGVNDPNNICNVSAAYTSTAFYAKWMVSTAKALLLRTAPAAPATANAPATTQDSNGKSARAS